MELLLWVLTATGLQQVREPVSVIECTMVLAMGRAAAEANAVMVHGDGEVVRISCGGRDVVLRLPPSDGSCDWRGI